MDRRRAAGALLALAACIACSTAAPTASNQTALELLEGPSEGCYYNFQHYGEGDRIMTNEPCLNCTCHNRMLMCYLKVCPFTKPIGQDCTIEKRADQCCPIVTCPDVPVDLLTSTSTSSPAEYGATGLGKVDKYGCSINGKYFPEGSKVPPTPNKPCEHCYCIRNMTTCVMQECTLHVDGCTPIYNKDVCCPVRYSCDHLEDEMLLLDDMTTTVRPTPGFLLTTTTVPSVTQLSQNCVHDDQIFADGALIKTEVACEHCYCMKGDIVCVVQECGTPMENEGKNCTSLPPRPGQCCPDTYICEGDELLTEPTTGIPYEELTTVSPPRRVEGSGYRNEPDEPYTEQPAFEGSGEEHATTLDSSDIFTSQKQTPEIIDEMFMATEESLKPSLSTIEPDKEQNTVPDDSNETTSDSQLSAMTTLAQEVITTAHPTLIEYKTTISDYLPSSEADSYTPKDDEFIMTTEYTAHYTPDESNKHTEMKQETETGTTELINIIEEVTTQQTFMEPSSSEVSMPHKQEETTTTSDISTFDEISEPKTTTPDIPKDDSETDVFDKVTQGLSPIHDKDDTGLLVTTTESRIEQSETTSINPVENEINEDVLPPGRIPGEGDCLLNGVTYKNNTNVPNINNCHSSCKCMSSIIKCDPIICSPPPEHMDNMNDCQPIYDTPDACCPTYVCHSRETIPPESHSQMSGTESPKPSIETECRGEQCQPQEINPITPNLCISQNCEPGTIVQEKECKDGICEQTQISANTSPSPSEPSETCIGDTCFPSVETCVDGICQKPITDETVCNDENGCQPSDACEGNNCVFRPEVPGTTNSEPICGDPEKCKVSDSSNCNGSKCETSSEDKKLSNENQVSLNCTEESCRRKEQPQENTSPLQCFGSDCITSKMEDESSVLTTESSIKDEMYKEPTTEIINDDEIQKVVNFETTTVSQGTSSDSSTDKSDNSSAEDLSEPVRDTGSSDSYATKMEETTTEIYNKLATEKETIFPDVTKPKEEVTESIEDITKEIPTESSFTTHYEKHSTDLPKEHLSSISTQPFESSTEIVGTESQDYEKYKDKVTDTSVMEEFTQIQETSTKPTDILFTTSNLLEQEVTEQKLIKDQDKFTEVPEEHTTRLEEEPLVHVTEKEESTDILSQDSANTESLPDVTTESSVLLLTEKTTENYIDIKIKNDDNADDITGQITTEQFIQLPQTSKPQESKLDETTTNKIYSEIEKDQISTEVPNMLSEVTSTETIDLELHKTEEESKSSQTTVAETFPVKDDTNRETTESFIKDQNILSQTTAYDTVTEKEDTYTISDATEEYVPSVSSIVHSTEPSITEENLVTNTPEIVLSQKDESNLSEPSIKESPTTTISEIFDGKEITTQEPGIPATNVYEITTETIDMHDSSSEAVSDKLEEHTGTPGKDYLELSTKLPEETFQEDMTSKKSPMTEPQESDITTNVTPILELETTSKPFPSIELGTTLSSVWSDKDQEITTEHTESEPGTEFSKENTVLPELHLTKSDEHTSVSAEIEKSTETLTNTQVGNEQPTTESLEKLYEDKSEMPDHKQTNHESEEPIIEGSTLASTISHTETYDDSNDKSITPVSIDESKIKEKPLYTTPGTITQYTEEQGIMSTIALVEGGMKGTEASEDINKTTEHTVLNEMEPHNIVTYAPDATTQSQNAETKLDTELQTETSIIPTHETKGETEFTVTLITEAPEHSDKIHDFAADKTTETTQTNVPVEEETKIPEHPLEHTTVQVSDYQDKEKTPSMTENTYLDISTEGIEKLTPSTVSELYLPDSHKSTTGAPVITSSELSYVTQEEDLPTRHPEISDSVTKVTDDYESITKLEDIPVKEHVLEDVTEQSENNVDVTTPGIRTSETVTETLKDTQQETDITSDAQESDHTITPEIFTTKYFENVNQTQNKQTEEQKPSEQEDHTLAPEQHITTEEPIQSSAGQDQDRPSEVFQTPEEKDVTTGVYQDLTTSKKELLVNVTESHISVTDILTTESPEILTSDDNNRRTLSPSLETIEPGQDTTEKQKITELPEMGKTQEMEQTDNTQISSNAPERESVTLVSMKDEIESVTLTPLATEGDIRYTAEVSDVTLKPNTERDDNEDLGTNPPVTVQDEITEKTTVHEDLIKIPVDTTPVEVPSEDVVPQTESSVPKETDISDATKTEAPVALVTQSEVSVPTETEISISKTTEPSVSEETEISILKVTEASVSEETKTSISEATEASVTIVSEPEQTEVSVSEVTVASVPKETEAPIDKISEVSELISEITEASKPAVTETSVPDVTKSEMPSDFAPVETETSTTGIAEDFKPETTETSVSEITIASISDVTKSTMSVSDDSTPIDSETVIGEYEGTTYKPKDEKLEIPVKPLSTLEPTDLVSETTPHLVELQEHTTKGDEDALSVVHTGEEATKAPETYQTERGDQPLENVPDKFTQQDSDDEHSTKGTFTKKDELLTTLPPEQPSVYPEKTPEKTEVPSESAMLTESDAQIGKHTTMLGEQSTTTSPTVSDTLKDHEILTTVAPETEITTDKKDLPSDTENTPEPPKPTITKTTTVKILEEITTNLPLADDKITKPEEKPTEMYSPTTAPELPNSGIKEIQPTEEVATPDFPPSGSSGYGQEPDYVEEDQAFGPGTCRYGGKVYVSAQQIPRDDPCDFCFCFRSDIICLQQSCPPPIHGCHEEPIQGFCCPRYECPVSMATTLNVTTTTTTTTTTLPPHFLPHAYKGAAQRRGCQIKGHSYKVGEVVQTSSGPCLHCTCGGDGQMKCDPKACTPEPMLRQMIAAAVSAKRRR